MEDELEADAPDKVNFVPCIKWVSRGIAKANPEKVQLNEAELEAIINDTKAKLGKAQQSETTANNTPSISKPENDDTYNFDNYDDPDDASAENVLGIGTLAVFSGNSKDPYVTVPDDDEEDSDAEDDVISPTDNLLVVGRVEGDMSLLEIYVYNEDEGSLYVHHDQLLSAFPLCLEWLSFDPSDEKDGNLVAVGSMDPVIEVYDLDVVGGVESAFKLGRRARKKKGLAAVGHSDAVLDLSWNKHLPHILGSGSADHTVMLWDLDSGQPATHIKVFGEKVQSLAFHPFESQTLLVGSCDSEARVFDCRTDDTFKSWRVEGEVERVLWDSFHPFCFYASTDLGAVSYVDCRNDKPLWKLSAHDGECTGLALSCSVPGLLATSGSDGMLKTWDVDADPTLVSERKLPIGRVLGMEACPDAGFVVAAGGDERNNNIAVWDLRTNADEVASHFGSRQQVTAVAVAAQTEPPTAMEVALDAMTLGPSTSRPRTSKGGKKREKHRKQ